MLIIVVQGLDMSAEMNQNIKTKPTSTIVQFGLRNLGGDIEAGSTTITLTTTEYRVRTGVMRVHARCVHVCMNTL